MAYFTYWVDVYMLIFPLLALKNIPTATVAHVEDCKSMAGKVRSFVSAYFNFASTYVPACFFLLLYFRRGL